MVDVSASRRRFRLSTRNPNFAGPKDAVIEYFSRTASGMNTRRMGHHHTEALRALEYFYGKRRDGAMAPLAQEGS